MKKGFSISSSALGRSAKILGMAGGLWKMEMVRLVMSALKNNQNQQITLKSRIQQATLLVEQLSSLKGAAMKVGQLLALEARDFVPDEVVQILEKLQSSASSMEFSLVKEILQRELGAHFSQLENLSPTPIAAASIGQVHTATIHGQKVAIKIQYPGVGQSIESDFKVLRQFVYLLLNVTGKNQIDIDPVLNELEATFRQETDYLLEAEFLKKYQKQAQNLPWLKVPSVHADFSTERVLTLDFAEGITVSEAVRKQILSPELRQHYAQLFLQTYVHEFCDWGLVQTDPNLGNFLLQPESKSLVLLDFGATKTFSKEFRVKYARLIMAAYNGDRQQILQRAQELDVLDPRESAATQELFVQMLERGMVPFKAKHYIFAEEKFSQEMREIGRQFGRSLRYTSPPRQLILLHRKLGGIFQILRRLGAELDLNPYVDPYRLLLASEDQANDFISITNR